MNAIITHEILKSWHPCAEGFQGFCRLFPSCATFKEISGIDVAAELGEAA